VLRPSTTEYVGTVRSSGPHGPVGSRVRDPPGRARPTPTGTTVVDRVPVADRRATVGHTQRRVEAQRAAPRGNPSPLARSRSPPPVHGVLVGATRASPIRAARRGHGDRGCRPSRPGWVRHACPLQGVAVVDRGAAGDSWVTVGNTISPAKTPFTPASLRSAPPLPLGAGEGVGGRGGRTTAAPVYARIVWERVRFSGPDGPVGSGTPDPYRGWAVGNGCGWAIGGRPSVTDHACAGARRATPGRTRWRGMRRAVPRVTSLDTPHPCRASARHPFTPPPCGRGPGVKRLACESPLPLPGSTVVEGAAKGDVTLTIARCPPLCRRRGRPHRETARHW